MRQVDQSVFEINSNIKVIMNVFVKPQLREEILTTFSFSSIDNLNY